MKKKRYREPDRLEGIIANLDQGIGPDTSDTLWLLGALIKDRKTIASQKKKLRTKRRPAGIGLTGGGIFGAGD